MLKPSCAVGATKQQVSFPVTFQDCHIEQYVGSRTRQPTKV